MALNGNKCHDPSNQAGGVKENDNAQDTETTSKKKEVAQGAQATSENKNLAAEVQTTNDIVDETTNSNNKPAQDPQTSNANNACGFPEDSSSETIGVNSPQGPEDVERWDATQYTRALVPASNKEKGGFFSQLARKWWPKSAVSQCSYVEADPNTPEYKIIYRSVIERSTKTPYPIKFYDPLHNITGIACVPKDRETASPETQIVAGGIGFNEVEILLTPVQKGAWACCVQINGVAGNFIEMGKDSE